MGTLVVISEKAPEPEVSGLSLLNARWLWWVNTLNVALFLVGLIASAASWGRYTAGVLQVGGPGAAIAIGCLLGVRRGRSKWGNLVLHFLTILALALVLFAVLVFALSDLRHHRIG